MCHFHVVASTLSLFYRGVTFRFLTKIFAAALLFYNVCSPLLSFPHCRFHVVASHIVASMLSLPRCRFHVVAPTLVASHVTFHVVAIRDLPGFQPRNHTQHGGHVLLADFYNSNFFMSLVSFRPLYNSWISLQHHDRYLKM